MSTFNKYEIDCEKLEIKTWNTTKYHQIKVGQIEVDRIRAQEFQFFPNE